MSKFRNIKVRVESKEQSEAVQKALFNDFCEWGDGTQVISLQYAKCLIVDGHGIMTAIIDPTDSRFNNHISKEVSAQSIIDPYYDVKIAWANGEVVQWVSKLGGGWFDWESDIKIDLNQGQYWRVKPKTKKIKVMMQDWYSPISGLTASSEVGVPDSKGWVKIGEPYEKEFEVPND